MKKENLSFAKSLCVALPALLLLSACDFQYMREVILGEREDQIVDGPRRVPTLNAIPAPVKAPSDEAVFRTKATDNIVPVAANTPTSVGVTPYDRYDADGKPAGNFFARLWSDDAPAAAPAAEPKAESVDAVRKPLPGNPYFSPETAQAAPTPMSAVKELSYPKLSSVPPMPKRFGEIKNEQQKNLSDLQTDHGVAQQDKAYLARDLAAEGLPSAAAPVAVPAPAALRSLDTVKPLMAVQPVAPQPMVASKFEAPVVKKHFAAPPAPVAAPAAQVSSLPAVNVAPAPAPQQVYVPAPVMVPAPQPAAQPSYSPPSYPAASAYGEALPSPDVIKTMKPSRYEQRRQTSNY